MFASLAHHASLILQAFLLHTVLRNMNVLRFYSTHFSSCKGNFVNIKYNLSGGYIPSFQKKEIGTVGQRIHLAPLSGQHTSKDYFYILIGIFFSSISPERKLSMYVLLLIS